MAAYGEWNRKGATLSDVTARKEYGVTRDFIIKGIEEGAGSPLKEPRLYREQGMPTQRRAGSRQEWFVDDSF